MGRNGLLTAEDEKHLEMVQRRMHTLAVTTVSFHKVSLWFDKKAFRFLIPMIESIILVFWTRWRIPSSHWLIFISLISLSSVFNMSLTTWRTKRCWTNYSPPVAAIRRVLMISPPPLKRSSKPKIFSQVAGACILPNKQCHVRKDQTNYNYLNESFMTFR